MERWYVTFEIAEDAEGGYTTTERGRSRVGRGATPIRAVVAYATGVEQSLVGHDELASAER